MKIKYDFKNIKTTDKYLIVMISLYIVMCISFMFDKLLILSIPAILLFFVFGSRLDNKQADEKLNKKLKEQSEYIIKNINKK